MTGPGGDVEALVRGAYAGDVEPLLDLARRRPKLVAPFHRGLIDAGVWWPDTLFHGMTEATARYLVEHIDAGTDDPDTWLSLLAAGRTATAVAAMRRWERDPPSWTAGLHWPVARYGHVGGWEFDDAGEVRPLTSDVSFALVPDSATRGDVSGGALSQRCPWCGLALWRLLDLDLTVLSGPWADRVGVTTCVRCGCWATIYSEFDDDGSARWADGNRRPAVLRLRDDTWTLPPGPGLRVGPPRPSPVAGTAWLPGGSTLGGRPDWMNDPDYPRCPGCGATMPYIAMITGNDLYGEPAEGCHYLFVHPPCHLAAAVYQQG
jgi:hypothetical protein